MRLRNYDSRLQQRFSSLFSLDDKEYWVIKLILHVILIRTTRSRLGHWHCFAFLLWILLIIVASRQRHLFVASEDSFALPRLNDTRQSYLRMLSFLANGLSDGIVAVLDRPRRVWLKGATKGKQSPPEVSPTLSNTGVAWKLT